MIPELAQVNVLASTRYMSKQGNTVDWATLRKSGIFETSRIKSRFVRKFYVVRHPLEDAEGFVNDLKNMVRSHGYDAVIPFTQATTLAISKLAHGIPTHTPSYDLLTQVNDKRRLVDTVDRVGGIRTPKIYSLDNPVFPCVVKAPKGSGGVGIKFVRNRQELSSALEYLERKKGDGIIHDFWPPIIQEYIPGLIHDCCTLYDQGEVKALITQERKVTLPPEGGAGAIVVSTKEEELGHLTRTLLDAIGWHGPCQVEWKLDSRDGEYKLLEINPRLWGTVELSIEAGVPFPLLAAYLAAGREVEPIHDYKVGVRHRFVFPRELYSCLQKSSHQRVFSIASFFIRFMDPRYQYTFDPTDLKPDILRTRHALKKVVVDRRSAFHSRWV